MQRMCRAQPHTAHLQEYLNTAPLAVRDLVHAPSGIYLKQVNEHVPALWEQLLF